MRFGVTGTQRNRASAGGDRFGKIAKLGINPRGAEIKFGFTVERILRQHRFDPGARFFKSPIVDKARG